MHAKPKTELLLQGVGEFLPGVAGFFDGAGVLDGGDVARVLAENDGLENAAHDLAAAGLGEHVDEIDVVDDADRPQDFAHGGDKLLAELVGGLEFLAQDDESGDDLAA